MEAPLVVMVTGPYVTQQRTDSKLLTSQRRGGPRTGGGANQLSHAGFAPTGVVVQFSHIDSTSELDGHTRSMLLLRRSLATDREMGCDGGKERR